MRLSDKHTNAHWKHPDRNKETNVMQSNTSSARSLSTIAKYCTKYQDSRRSCSSNTRFPQRRVFHSSFLDNCWWLLCFRWLRLFRMATLGGIFPLTFIHRNRSGLSVRRRFSAVTLLLLLLLGVSIEERGDHFQFGNCTINEATEEIHKLLGVFLVS